MNRILLANQLPGTPLQGMKRGDTAQAYRDPANKTKSIGLVKLIKPAAKKMYVRNLITGYTECHEEWECWSYLLKRRINQRFIYEVKTNLKEN